MIAGGRRCGRRTSQLPGQHDIPDVGRENRSSQILARIDAMQLRGLEQAVEGRGDLRPTARLRPIVVLAADDGPPFILPMSARSPSFTTAGIPSSDGPSLSRTANADTARTSPCAS